MNHLKLTFINTIFQMIGSCVCLNNNKWKELTTDKHILQTISPLFLLLCGLFVWNICSMVFLYEIVTVQNNFKIVICQDRRKTFVIRYSYFLIFNLMDSFNPKNNVILANNWILFFIVSARLLQLQSRYF
jgi:hypothetical protein